jgi:hypothetical protein
MAYTAQMSVKNWKLKQHPGLVIITIPKSQALLFTLKLLITLWLTCLWFRVACRGTISKIRIPIALVNPRELK